ncbi:unnamed protein product [Parnassius mnemosyne]|uniref:Transposase n=1 Tax=Parnassius mnemosyne TaxID=213953 RepID=A0AAV1M9J9_9NEOP
MPKSAKGEVYKKKYTEEDLEAAIQAIQNGMSKRAAAKVFGIPRGTLQFRLQGNFLKTRPGPPTILTNDEENTLVEWIIQSSRKGFPRRKEDLLHSVTDFLKKSPRPNNFIDNKPGEGWYKLFLKRHPEIVQRTAEAVTSASANVSEKNIKKWFQQIETWLEEEEFLHILRDPKRIFNGDETNFLLCPKTSKVLALKGTRDVYEVDNAPAKCGLTVMFTFSATGVITPPMIIYPLKRNRADITASVPPEWGIGLSSNGWMNKDLFLQYITNVLHPHLVKENTKFPILLFVDGHKSHINFELSKACKERGIILIALYPNATRILQPADVAAFKPIKSAWKKGVLEWRRENATKNLTKIDFGPILSIVLKKYIDKQIIINGFRACGLYPWNPNAINYQKCLGKNVTQSTRIQENRPQRAITFTDFEKIVGQNIVSRLTSETPDKSNCFYKALKDIYDHLKGKDIEQEDSTTSSDYLVIENELITINDIPIVISNSNNIEESHTDTIETETTEYTELLTTDLFDDLETLNLTESYDLSADIRNTIKMNANL